MRLGLFYGCLDSANDTPIRSPGDRSPSGGARAIVALTGKGNVMTGGSDWLDDYIHLSAGIPGWTRGEEARELARISFSLPAGANIVEIGAFLGASAILLAGPRRLRQSGVVHCVDPFDCSGDLFSIPYYQRILAEAGGGSLRELFERNIRKSGVGPWVQIHQGRAAEVARNWEVPIDLLYLDGDQSRAGAREAYEAWAQFLKPGGVIALHNSRPEHRVPDHDGHRWLVEEEITAPYFESMRLVRTTTFAIKC
jgi:MMP 1-O-methyltransferase